MSDFLVSAYLYALTQKGVYITDKESGIEIYIYQEQGAQIVNILASNSWNDWKTNFKFLFKRWKRPDYARESSPIRVHSGYFNAWMKVRGQVLNELTASKILVTGFSMGGGISSIAAVDIQVNRPNAAVACTDFDGAKVWNRAGKESVERRIHTIYKIVNGNDIVTKVPPGYYYAGRKIHIGEKEKWYRVSIKDHADMIMNVPLIIERLIAVPDIEDFLK